MLQCGHQQALFRLTRHHRRSRLTPLADTRSCVDLESSLEHLGRGGLGRMALVAVADQHRSDLGFKEIQPLAVGSWFVGGVSGRGDQQAGKNGEGVADGVHPGCPW